MDKEESSDRTSTTNSCSAASPTNFIREMIEQDLSEGKNDGRVATRFPPEPNGYLHIGHAKSICLNFGLAAHFEKGTCNLRFDDTNPSTEDVEYVDSIMQDIRWLGFDWEDRLFFASDYFERLYGFAGQLIRAGKAYVCSLTESEIRKFRGDYFTKAEESPYRNRSVEENLALFESMRAGKFEDGAHVLRAKIDMSSPNMNMRDPILYRIRRQRHHRTGNEWCIYPMYDFAHGQSDAIEQITHSICTLEFEDHRPLYDWFTEQLGFEKPPRQIEFARLNLTYTVMSKRKLLILVEKGLVSGWDDPRMPTISGLRRRGYTPESIRSFCDRIGVAKADSIVDMALLEYCIREDLNARAPRVMGVLNPLKVVIDNFPEGNVETIDAPYLPEDFSMGSRPVPFSRELFIERDDFREDPPNKWYRLAPGREVRLRYACLITCVDVVRDESTGEVVEVHCTWDPDSRGGTSPDGRKVKGTLHWVSATQSIPAEVRLYDRLFNKANPLDDKDGSDFLACLNPDSLNVVTTCRIEPNLAEAKPESRWQFERLGYFCVDTVDSTPDHLVFNRTVTLRDTWAKIEKAQNKASPKKKINAKKSTEGKKSKNPGPAEQIAIDDFIKLDIRVGVVREATLVEGADKLIRLMVDVGEQKDRQIFSGIRSTYPHPEVLVGKNVLVVANLTPRKMKFGVSEGMVLAGGDGELFRVATVDGPLPPGSRVT